MEQLIHKLHDSDDTIDEMIKVVGIHIQSEINNSEKHCNVYPDASDIIPDHNLAVLPRSLCVNIHMEPSLLRLRNWDLTSLVSLSIPTVFCVEDSRKPRNSLIWSNMNLVRSCSESRKEQADEWADAVWHWLACVSDLPAREAVYHRRCFQYFMSPRNLTLYARTTINDGSPPRKRGHPSGAADKVKKTAFMNVIEHGSINVAE